MLSSKLKYSAFAGFIFVICLFAWNSESGAVSAQLYDSPICTQETKETNEPKPAPEPSWKTEFRTAYGLNDGEILKRVAPPFLPCRNEFCRTLKELIPDVAPEDILMSYRWDGKNVERGSISVSSPGNTGWSLMSVLHDLGVPHQEMEGDLAWLRQQQIEGEFVVRTGAPVEKLVPRLQQILREELKLPIQLTLVQAEREVVVVGGKYESKPIANRMANEVDLFAVVRRAESDAGGGSGTFAEFLTATGGYIGRRLVSDLGETPKGRIAWYYHNSTQVLPGPDPNMDAEGVLKNITAQTGLTFKLEKRKVRVLRVEKRMAQSEKKKPREN